MSDFCVECGRDADRLFNGSCAECYLKGKKFVSAPLVIDVIVCVHCGARQHKKSWVAPDQPLIPVIHDAVISSLEISKELETPTFEFSEEYEDEKNLNVEVTVRGLVAGFEVEEVHALRARIQRSVCGRCSREQGGYFEAILQLRARERDVSPEELERAGKLVHEELAAMRSSGAENAFVSDYQEIHGGADYYLGDKDAGKQLAHMLMQKFGGEANVATKLMGQKEGKDAYRITYLVRIPAYKWCDFIKWGDEYYRIASLSKEFAAITDLRTHIKKQRRHRDLDNAKVVGGAGMILEAVILGQTPKEVQIMHPKSFKTMDVLKPEGYSNEGETVQIVVIEDAVYLVP